jgi:hypothetical protein
VKPDQPFSSNSNKEYIRSAVDQPIIEQWFRNLGRGLKYLGLPAWQMLDIVAWQNMLGRFTGIERAENQQHLMFLNANIKDLEHRLYALYGRFDDIILNGRDNYKKCPDWPYDLVNLDVFGGFLYSNFSRPKAFRKIIANQAAHGQSFLLIVTQHLRDGDLLKEKDKFLSDLGNRLKGAVLDRKIHSQIDRVTTWYRDADIPDAARQALYMNFFLREFGESELFKVKCRPAIIYAGTGNSSMIHFVTDFIYEPSIAHRAASDQSLVDVINLGLLEAKNGKLREKSFPQPKLSLPKRRRTSEL